MAADKRKTHSLLALGSAAVIAIYAAGYTRTRAVALRLAEDEHRRPMIPAPPEAGPAPVMPEPPAAQKHEPATLHAVEGMTSHVRPRSSEQSDAAHDADHH